MATAGMASSRAIVMGIRIVIDSPLYVSDRTGPDSFIGSLSLQQSVVK